MSRFKRVPTKRLEAIINDPFTRGVDGADYEMYRDEILGILYKRRANNLNEELSTAEKEMDYYENYVIFTLQDPEVIKWLLSNFEKLEMEGFFGNY